MNEIRTSNSFGALVVLPLAGVYVSTETGLVKLDPASLLTTSAVFLIATMALFLLCRAAFRREEILTKRR